MFDPDLDPDTISRQLVSLPLQVSSPHHDDARDWFCGASVNYVHGLFVGMLGLGACEILIGGTNVVRYCMCDYNSFCLYSYSTCSVQVLGPALVFIVVGREAFVPEIGGAP